MRISDWSSDVCSSDLGQKDGVVAQGPEFLSDRREELLVIAAREVGAADRALEQYVADDRELRWLVVKDDMPRRVPRTVDRSEEHTSELQSLMRISYAVFCLKKKNI